MARPSSTLRLFVLSFLLALPYSASFGIIIRHDRSDIRYQADEHHYPQLFFLHTSFDNKVCVGTLITERWAITAAHCTEETPLLETVRNDGDFTLTIARKQYRVEELVLHPRYDAQNELDSVDLALVRLDRDVEGITPVKLYRGQGETGQVFSLLGWGFTGIGTRGLQTNDGKFRRAENRVTKAGQWLEFLFDDPRNLNGEALNLEGVPGLGDSGGPALLETEDGFVLAGIAVGELEEGEESPEHQGLYGTTQLYERISSHLEWIDQIISR